MNYRMIMYILGWIFKIQACCLFLPMFVGIIYSEAAWKSYAAVAVVLLLFGIIFSVKKPKKMAFFAKEGYIIVAMSWILLSVTGALPFVATGEIPNFVDAVFEAASGFSTTGASVITNLDVCSHATLFWRSFMHWIGGMGVLVFLLAIVPFTGGYSMELMKAESPGPIVGKFVPKVRKTAFILYAIYIAMTFLQFIILLIAKMPGFDALTLTLGTAGTGGFSIKNSGFSEYTMLQQGIITVFMLLFSVNFSVYYLLIMKKVKQAFKIEEVKWFFIVVGVSILTITLNIYKSCYGGKIFEAFHHSAFSVATVVSTTGYATADFDSWPQLSKFILFALMFMGACAGSTGGGIKVSRFVILVKNSVREIGSIIHPRSVKVVKLDGKRVEHEVLKRTTAYFITFIAIYVTAVLIVSLDNFDMVTSLTSVAATINNIGPGLAQVGPTGNYAAFSSLSKIVFIFLMIAGRLELFPMLVLLSPTTWKGTPSVVKRKLLAFNRKITGKTA